MRTRQGDTFELLAWRELGSTKYTEALINANRQYVTTQVFEAGAELETPTVNSAATINLPPWKK